MDLWLARKGQNGAFIPEERVSLAGFEDLFESELVERGSRSRLLFPETKQEVELRCWILPAYGQLRRSGQAKAIEARVRESLSDLTNRLDEGGREISAGSLGTAREALAVLDVLMRTKRSLKAIVVS